MNRKLNLLIYAFIFSIISIQGYAQSPTEASAYMGQISTPFEEMKKESWAYLKAVTRGKGDQKVEAKRSELINKVKAAKYEVSRMHAYYGDLDLKKAVLNYFDITYKVMNEDFDKIMDMEEIAEQSYDLMEAYLLAKEKAGETLEEAGKEFDKVYNNFAAKNNVNLVEGEADRKSKKIQKASDALGYYNDFYLMFFKSYKQEAYAIDAMNRNDLNAFEQNANSLIDFSNEGINKAKSQDAFHGDNSLKLATQEVLTFYKKEAQTDFKAVSDFYIKKDNFEKVQKMMDSKKKKDRTQKDIDQYNNALNEYNTAVEDYNKALESMNKKREQSLKEWNKSVEKFFNEHA